MAELWVEIEMSDEGGGQIRTTQEAVSNNAATCSAAVKLGDSKDTEVRALQVKCVKHDMSGGCSAG